MTQRIVIERQATDGPKRRTIYEPDLQLGDDGEWWEIEEVKRLDGSWRETGRQHVAEPAVHLEAAAPGTARPATGDD
jgi:hypothetical protein